jgi:hypothetical protein
MRVLRLTTINPGLNRDPEPYGLDQEGALTCDSYGDIVSATAVRAETPAPRRAMAVNPGEGRSSG